MDRTITCSYHFQVEALLKIANPCKDPIGTCYLAINVDDATELLYQKLWLINGLLVRCPFLKHCQNPCPQGKTGKFLYRSIDFLLTLFLRILWGNYMNNHGAESGIIVVLG